MKTCFQNKFRKTKIPFKKGCTLEDFGKLRFFLLACFTCIYQVNFIYCVRFCRELSPFKKGWTVVECHVTRKNTRENESERTELALS